ncbi:MAG: hypothetical protein HY716_06165 [Planctomycetes bacterium]|nr:hypothetical protein [Planctomycetota bacterium]
MPLMLGVVTFAALAGYLIVKRSNRAAIPATAPSQPAPKELAEEKPDKPEAEPSPVPAPKRRPPPKPPVKAPDNQAPKPQSALPPALANVLKLDASQEAEVAKVMAEWRTKLEELNKKTSEALRTATKEESSFHRDAWRQQFTVLKNSRTMQLNKIFTPEQETSYREYRDTQYQAWLDRKVSHYTTLASHTLKLNEGQLSQIKPLVRRAFDDATSGGTFVPPESQRTLAKQLLQQQVMSFLTAEQAEKFIQNERAFDLHLW